MLLIILNEQEIFKKYQMNQAIKDVKSMLYHKKNNKIISPSRTVIEFPEEDGSVLYMPSTDLNENIMSIKTVTIFPNNPSRNKSTTQGVILLSDATNGDHVALLNASYLTRLRTGAMSSIATDKMAKEDAHTLAVIGTGGMAFEQVIGVLEARSIQEILLINPTKEKAERFKKKLQDFGIDGSITIRILEDVAEAVNRAQIINCSTRSNTPVFKGKDIQPGTHVNGVGSYLPHMREVDHTFITKADRIIVDDLEASKEEAGELIYANKQSEWSFEENIHGELIDLITNETLKRKNNSEVTFFKSVGAAYYDLAVANGAYKQAINKKQSVRVDM